MKAESVLQDYSRQTAQAHLEGHFTLMHLAPFSRSINSLYHDQPAYHKVCSWRDGDLVMVKSVQIVTVHITLGNGLQIEDRSEV